VQECLASSIIIIIITEYIIHFCLVDVSLEEMKIVL
jgi:hypothetical protein